jgi:hypothetical protein
MREMSDSEYGDLLKRKRVVIVAHASSLVGSSQGQLIDSYDLVVRVNDSVPIPEDLKSDIGTRCDILYSSMAPQFRVTHKRMVQPLIDVGVKVICRPTPLKLRPIQQVSLTSYDVTRWRDRLVESLEDAPLPLRVINDEVSYIHHLIGMKGGKLPLTGFAAIWDLLSFAMTEIFMIGFNFFVGETYDQYAARPVSPNQKQAFKMGTGFTSGRWHVTGPQLSYLKTLMMKDSRIKVDRELSRILSETR